MRKFLICLFIITSLFCFVNVCFANSDEDLIESMLDEKISYLQTYMDNNFKGNDYIIIKSTSNSNKYKILLAKESFRNISYSNNEISNQFNGGGYVISLEKEPWGTTINLLERNEQEINTERDYNIIFAKNYNNLPQTEILNNYFFMKTEVPVEIISGEQQAEITPVEISGELPEIVMQLQEMSAEKMELEQTITTIVLVAISCLVLLISCVVLSRVLRIFL